MRNRIRIIAMRRSALILAAVIAVLSVATHAVAETPQPVTISVHRDVNGDVWSSTGAFQDAGSFRDHVGFFAGSSTTYHVFRTFRGDAGRFVARGDVRISPSSDPDVLDVTGRWAIVSGSGSYAGAHGSGWIHEAFDTAVGQIAGTWAGQVVFSA